MRKTSTAMVALAAGFAITAPAMAEELVIESWRNDDISVWQDVIIPAFNAQHPDIEVTFPADRTGRVQCRPERQARWRHRR